MAEADTNRRRSLEFYFPAHGVPYHLSQNIEDRRNEPAAPVGPFGTPGYPQNVFQQGGGTMIKLDPQADFAMPPADPALGNQLGLAALDYWYRQHLAAQFIK